VISRTFIAKELLDAGLPSEAPAGGEICETRIIARSRWSVVYSLVFRFADTPTGYAWRVTYSIGAAEAQDERPWEHGGVVDATLVRLVHKTVDVWEDADTTHDSDAQELLNAVARVQGTIDAMMIGGCVAGGEALVDMRVEMDFIEKMSKTLLCGGKRT
jgi:hypothetical protein